MTVANPPVAPAVDPHLVDEDPELLMGEVTLDPWSDNTQIDWPNNSDEQDDDSDEEVAE